MSDTNKKTSGWHWAFVAVPCMLVATAIFPDDWLRRVELYIGIFWLCCMCKAFQPEKA